MNSEIELDPRGWVAALNAFEREFDDALEASEQHCLVVAIRAYLAASGAVPVVKGLEWQTIDSYPRCENCDDPDCDWGPEVQLLIPHEPGGPFAYIGHREAGMWLCRCPEDPETWAGALTSPTHWAAVASALVDAPVQEAAPQREAAKDGGAVRRIPENNFCKWCNQHLEDGHHPQCESFRAIAEEELAAALRVPSESEAIRALRDERRRQVEVEGWTPEHDDQHILGELAKAAASYAAGSAAWTWPWDRKWWKPADPRRNLVKAGALIIAEIERLDRAAIERSKP